MQVNISNGFATITMSEAEFFKRFKPEELEQNLNVSNTSKATGNFSLFNEVTFLLSQVNIPKNLKWYILLRAAIILCIEQPHVMNKITTQLYPMLAQKYKDSPTRVERAIRHAIEVSWKKENVDILNRLFNTNLSTDIKLKNSQFICLFADHIQSMIQSEAVTKSAEGCNK